VPQVQLIGNGTVYNHEGLDVAPLKHPSHATFHKTVLSPDDQRAGLTRFYRWHIDAALYDFSPPKVTTLYAIQVPEGPPQTCRYDDGTGDELPVPLGTTAFVSGKNMFDMLPRRMQSLAVRTRVRYAPHPYEWMSPASAHSTGLAIENEGKELALDDLPPWTEDKVKVLPMVRLRKQIFLLPQLLKPIFFVFKKDVEESGDGSFAFSSASVCCTRDTHRSTPL
jgi:xanthine dioxygenase